MSFLSALLAAVVVGTWNGNWFPSHRAEHRASPEAEAETIASAAQMLAVGIAELDPAGTNDVILCLNEIRGRNEAERLVGQIGRKGLRVASVSGYRARGNRHDYQQDVIATTLPVVESRWERWKGAAGIFPPRGYAFAAVVIDPATTANVYAVHLKADYHVKTAAERAENRAKRTVAVEQILALEKKRRGAASRPVIVAGDMNADCWSGQFADERLFALLGKAGFANLLEMLPPKARATHPSKRFGDSTLDYVFCRGLHAPRRPRIVANDGLSDHFAVFGLLER